MVQKSSELHSLLKGIAFNVETQEQNKNSERNVNQDLAILLLETPEFENINLKLSWNIEIQCVFPQSEVFVINSLNKPEKSDEQGFGDDSSEEMSSKSDLSNDSDEDQNISSSTKKEKKKRKKRKKKKTPASKTKSDKYTNPSLIFFNDYEKDIVDFDGKQSIINYSEICTLFYKKSKKKNPEDDKKKEKKILNLLSELNYGTEKNFVVDNDAVFEIAFTNDYGDREILVLLGCLNLHLANIMIEHSTFQKVILKFSPFESQANFLKRIQEHVFNKLLMKVGLCMDLTNIKLT
jgi:hypothetical protein